MSGYLLKLCEKALFCCKYPLGKGRTLSLTLPPLKVSDYCTFSDASSFDGSPNKFIGLCITNRFILEQI